MATVYTDLVDGFTVTQTPLGYSITKKELVDGLTGSTGDDKINNAITATAHILGEQHSIYTDSYIQSITATAISSSQVEVTMQYEPMTNIPDNVQISNRVTSSDTNKDYNDSAIEVAYTYPTDYQANPELAGKTDTVGKQLQKQIPTTCVSITRREASTGNTLIGLSASFVGTLNASGWTYLSGDEKDWLCTGIDSTFVGYVYDSVDGLKWMFDVTYNFEKQLGGWDTSVVYIMPDTGEPPAPDTWESGVTNKNIQLYATANFNNLIS